ncbi:MAG: hypothetical protein IMZ66_13710 [Planctomycetes bacterium]|nr:hypothetical protein [Planctomycetota bacterium]
MGDPFDVCESRSARAAARVLDQTATPADRVLAFPYTSYSLAWYLWPREVPYMTDADTPDAEPSLEALVRELNRPERTFVVLYKRKAVDYLQEKVRWPVTVLSREPRVAVIVTEPPGGEVADEP